MGERSFFVEPGAIAGDRAELRGPPAHQIRSVLRLRPGDDIELLDGSGFVYAARLVESGKDVVVARVVSRRGSDTEPWSVVKLYQALLKGQKMELVLQKGTEIGVSRFVPVVSERCVSRPSEADMKHRLRRWQAVVREAAEQSGRAVLPEVTPAMAFDEACRSAACADVALMAWEGERSAGLREVLRSTPAFGAEALGGERLKSPLRSAPAPQAEVAGRPRISLLVGPEGGFSPREAEVARRAGVRTAGLGARILRAETAALVAATLALGEMGDLDG